MAGRFPWLKRASPDDEVADADPSDGWQRHIQTLKEAGIPEPGVAVQGNRPATQADEEALYGVAPSFVELLPWVEYLPDSRCMLLEDGQSVGAFFELIPLGTEGREAAWLAQARDRKRVVWGKGVAVGVDLGGR